MCQRYVDTFSRMANVRIRSLHLLQDISVKICLSATRLLEPVCWFACLYVAFSHLISCAFLHGQPTNAIMSSGSVLVQAVALHECSYKYRSLIGHGALFVHPHPALVVGGQCKVHISTIFNIATRASWAFTFSTFHVVAVGKDARLEQAALQSCCQFAAR